jgi:hypothetical protein
VRVDLLFGVFRLEQAGTIDETIDRRRGRYEVRIDGQGDGIASAIESHGTLRDGRWAPLHTRSRFVVHGRESRLDIQYDYERGQIDFHGRQETFLLRRLRVTDDLLPVPATGSLDDVVSAALNFADGRWRPVTDGTLATQVVRRRRGAREGTDDVESSYRAEIVPLVLRVEADGVTGRSAARFDLTRFSSWARESEPARIVFGPDRRPAQFSSTLMLGTTVTALVREEVAR